MSDMYMDAMHPCPNCGAERWAGGSHKCHQLANVLTFERLREVNASRCQRWLVFGIDEWSPADWAVAMLGEAGEAANAIKKLRRIETRAKNLNKSGRELTDRAAAIAAVGEELADTAIYMDLLALRLGIDLSAEIVKKFNSVSRRYGFPERL